MLPRSVSPLPLGSDLPPLRMFGRLRRSDSPAPPLPSSSISLGGNDGTDADQHTSYIDNDGYTITTSVEGEGTVPHRNSHDGQQQQQQQHSSPFELPTFAAPVPMNAQRPYVSPFSVAPAHPSAPSYPSSASLSALAHSKLMDPFSSGIVGFPMTATARGRGGLLADGADRSEPLPLPSTTRTNTASGGPLLLPAHPPSLTSLWSSDASPPSAPSLPAPTSMTRFGNLLDGFDTGPHSGSGGVSGGGGSAYERLAMRNASPVPAASSSRSSSPSLSSFSSSSSSLPPPSFARQPSPSPSFQPLSEYGSSFMQQQQQQSWHPMTQATSASTSTSTSPSLGAPHGGPPPRFPSPRGTTASPVPYPPPPNDVVALGGMPPHFRERGQPPPPPHHHQSLQRPTPHFPSPTTSATTTTTTTATGAMAGRPAGTRASVGHASSSSPPLLHFGSGASPSSLPSPMGPSNVAPRVELSCPEFQLNLSTYQADPELIEEVYLFGQNYKAHCWELFRATREGLFAHAQDSIARFWPLVGGFQRLLSIHAVVEQIIRFDKLFYEALVEAAVGDIDNRRTDFARAVLEFAQGLPCWTFHAASRALPPSLFHPKMTLLKRSAREMMLRAQVGYFGGLLLTVFNESVLGRPLAQVLSDPHLHLAAGAPPTNAGADGGQSHERMTAKRPRTSNGGDGNGNGYYDSQHTVGEESSNDAWNAKTGANGSSNGGHYGVKQEGEGANVLKRSLEDGGDNRADKDAGDETALVVRKMFEDWSSLDAQALVTDMMRQHGASSLWSVAAFSPVLVMRLIAEQLERKARLEHWFASFVESYLIKDLLLDHRDTSAAWYAAIPFTNRDGVANASNGLPEPNRNPSNGVAAAAGGRGPSLAKPLSDSHVFCMQWRCFSSQVLRSLESNRASTAGMFSILFAWVDALLDFFLDKRRAHFLSLSASKRTVNHAHAAGVTEASRRGAPYFQPPPPPPVASGVGPERSGPGVDHGMAAVQQQRHPHHQQQQQQQQQRDGGWPGGTPWASDLRQPVPQSSQHYYHELQEQHRQQQEMHARMAAQAHGQPDAAAAAIPAAAAVVAESSPTSEASLASRQPSPPGSGSHTPLSPPPTRAHRAKRQKRSSTTATTTTTTTATRRKEPGTLTSHLFQFRQRPSSSSSAGPGSPAPQGSSPSSASSSLPTVPSKLRSPSEVMSQLGLPQSLLARMQRNVSTSTLTPPSSSSSPAALLDEAATFSNGTGNVTDSSSSSRSNRSSDALTSSRKAGSTMVSYSSESSPSISSSSPSPSSPSPPLSSSSSSSSVASFNSPRYLLQR